MPESKLTPEEVSAITGEDIEDVRNEQHPERNPLYEKESGAPDIESASWDNEIEEEDKDDIHLKDLDFEKLTPIDRSLYLEMVALRKTVKEGPSKKDLRKDCNELVKKFEETRVDILNPSRREFLGMLGNKIQILDFELSKKEDEK